MNQLCPAAISLGCTMHFVVARSMYNVFFRVVDLGVMVPCETILQSVAKEKVETMLLAHP